ncbi:MAG: YihY/virulence factor BrkB family protein [Actinomycetota bacterium]|nr:YihY/virulence factor BrkB family protein [Actinomycetota bacterium]
MDAHAREQPAQPAEPGRPASAGARRRARRAWRYLKALYVKGYEDNVTGLSGMVAYNLLLSLFPLALVALFVAGSVLQSTSVEESVVSDLRELFPDATETTISDTLDRVRDNATSFGIVALVASIWFGSSFWGALDTAFCRIYHVECRKWVEQKRFGLIMLVVILVFMAATVALPTLQTTLVRGARDLPFGLAGYGDEVFLVTLAVGTMILFWAFCLIYWAVPNRSVPWRAVWPGALAATLAIAVIDYVFPAYLDESPLTQVGSTLVFIMIILIWFYAIAFVILGGALINALRFEKHDTEQLEIET